jgi:hypothetical protein
MGVMFANFDGIDNDANATTRRAQNGRTPQAM